MTRGLPGCLLAVAVAGCGGAAAAPAKPAPSGSGGGDAANDCPAIEKIMDGEKKPDPETPGDIARAFNAVAKSLRATSFVGSDVRDLANGMADHFQKIAANGALLEKDHADLVSTVAAAKAKNASFENAVAGIKGVCDMQKPAKAECVKLVKVVEAEPFFKRTDADDPTPFIAKLSAFRKDLLAVRVNSGQVKESVSAAEEKGAALESALKEMKAVGDSGSAHSLETENDALLAKMNQLCPKPAKR